MLQQDLFVKYPEIKIVRTRLAGSTTGETEVWIDDFKYATLHYDPRFTCSQTQWDVANELAQRFRHGCID